MTFARAGYALAKHCDFADRDKEIKDRFIGGVQNKGLAEYL